MHIIIPMSGVGQRFIDAGYKDPKPLIKVDGKPIIEHVVNLFPGETKFTFICNATHLAETDMRSVLEDIAPKGNIIEIPNHKKGPVYAVLQASELIEDHEETIVSYCDFGTYWNYANFLKETRSKNADGAVVSYRGFHPHMLGTTNYAFMREKEGWMLEIKEKEPFTNDRMNEYASNGIYYFKRGSSIKKYFQELINKNLNLNGEFYVSLVYNLLVESGLKVSIYEIEHMLQWGTPQDLEEYKGWSDYFSTSDNQQQVPVLEEKSIKLTPLAGHGSRFKKEGYTIPKPLIEINGKPMVVEAANGLPKAKQNIFVCLEDHLNKYPLKEALEGAFKDPLIVSINEVTEGQAITCSKGLEDADENASLLIGASDNGMIYDQEKYKSLIADSNIDAIVWTFKNHPSSNKNPQMYGWVKTDHQDFITGCSIKKQISEDPSKDHAIVGAFYFRKVAHFKKALDQLISKNIRVNSEFYVDSLIGELLNMNLNVKAFEVDHYTCWGTPNDYKTFIYWQTFFSKLNKTYTEL